jgi:hypothetical protein
MDEQPDETPNETRWWESGTRSRRYRPRWAVFDLLINERLIASRIAERMELTRGTVSKHIKSLQHDGFIRRAEGLEQHYQQVRDGSVTGTHKAYIEGPHGALAQKKIHEMKANTGVSGAEPAANARPPTEPTPLPAGVEPVVDLHRLDFLIPLERDTDGNPIQPLERTIEQWRQSGVAPKVGQRQGFALMGRHNHRSNWGWWEVPEPMETGIGNFKVHLKRRWNSIRNNEDEEIGIEWGEWSPTVRITGPRIYCTIEETLNPQGTEGQVGTAVWDVAAELSRQYGFRFGLAHARTAQPYEWGALRYDPELAQRVRQHRRANPEMLRVAEGITADGSHDLLNEGFVHLDCEEPQQAAMQANPIQTLDHMMRRVDEMTQQFQAMTDNSMVAIEEHAVRATDNISNELEGQLGTIVVQLQNSMQQTLEALNERFDIWLQEFAGNQQDRVNRAIERFERRLRGLQPEDIEGQMTLFDFDENDNEDLGA